MYIYSPWEIITHHHLQYQGLMEARVDFPQFSIVKKWIFFKVQEKKKIYPLAMLQYSVTILCFTSLEQPSRTVLWPWCLLLSTATQPGHTDDGGLYLD